MFVLQPRASISRAERLGPMGSVEDVVLVLGVSALMLKEGLDRLEISE